MIPRSLTASATPLHNREQGCQSYHGSLMVQLEIRSLDTSLAHYLRLKKHLVELGQAQGVRCQPWTREGRKRVIVSLRGDMQAVLELIASLASNLPDSEVLVTQAS